MQPLLKPEKIELQDLDGVTHEFIIHRLPSLVGREISTQYIGANLPRFGDYEKSAELLAKLMSYVTKKIGDLDQPLDTPELIENHVPDCILLSKLEDAMIAYNTDFLPNGKGSIFSTIAERTLIWFLAQMSRELSPPSSEQDKPNSTN